MHRFLRSIGFSGIKTDQEAEVYLDRAVNEKYRSEILVLSPESRLEEYCMQVAPSMGIMVVGHRDNADIFHRDYYFPFVRSFDGTLTEEGSLERHAERETYEGVLEDFRSGITLIFYLCNSVEMRGIAQAQIPVRIRQAFLTGLATEGKILLPTQRKEDEESCQRRLREQKALYEAARNGDEDAIETLTETDMNLMSEVNARIEHEDLYSVVESSFMPTGVECDQYTVLGEITGIRVKTNVYTHENVVDLRLRCNDAVFHVCINEADLVGVPAVGRRFKGRIWMQGFMEFAELPSGEGDGSEEEDNA